MARRIIGRAILLVSWVSNSNNAYNEVCCRIVQSFETITLDLANNTGNFTISEEKLSVKLDRASCSSNEETM